MYELDEIKNKLLDKENYKLSDVARQFYIFAKKHNQDKLAEYLKNELDGYENKTNSNFDIPKYRQIDPDIFIYDKIKRNIVSEMYIPDNLKNELKKLKNIFYIRYNIEEIENLIVEIKNSNYVFDYNTTDFIKECLIITKSIIPYNNNINSCFGIKINKFELQQILSEIRNNLTEELINLEKQNIKGEMIMNNKNISINNINGNNSNITNQNGNNNKIEKAEKSKNSILSSITNFVNFFINLFNK